MEGVGEKVGVTLGVGEGVAVRVEVEVGRDVEKGVTEVMGVTVIARGEREPNGEGVTPRDTVPTIPAAVGVTISEGSTVGKGVTVRVAVPAIHDDWEGVGVVYGKGGEGVWIEERDMDGEGGGVGVAGEVVDGEAVGRGEKREVGEDDIVNWMGDGVIEMGDRGEAKEVSDVVGMGREVGVGQGVGEGVSAEDTVGVFRAEAMGVIVRVRVEKNPVGEEEVVGVAVGELMRRVGVRKGEEEK